MRLARWFEIALFCSLLACVALIFLTVIGVHCRDWQMGFLFQLLTWAGQGKTQLG